MRIEIHPDTPDEQAAMKEPVVFKAVKRFGLAGLREPVIVEGKIVEQAEFGHIAGPWLPIKSDLARMTFEVDHSVAEQVAFGAAIKAHNHIMQQAQAQQIGESLRNGKSLRFKP